MRTGSFSKPLLLTGSPRIILQTSVVMVEAGKAAGDRFHPWAAQGPGGDQGCLGTFPALVLWCHVHRFCPGTLRSLFLPFAVNFQPLLWMINKSRALPAAAQELWLHGSEHKHSGAADALGCRRWQPSAHPRAPRGVRPLRRAPACAGAWGRTEICLWR